MEEWRKEEQPRARINIEGVDDTSELCIEMGSVEMVEVRVTTSLAEMGSMLGLRPGFVVAVQTGWDMEDADHAREVEKLLTNEDTF